MDIAKYIAEEIKNLIFYMLNHIKLEILISLIIFSLNCIKLAGQTSQNFYCNYNNGVKPKELCDNYNALAPKNGKTYNTVEKILECIGLPFNFVLVSCPGIDNAVAIVLNNGLRCIVYDPLFVEKMQRTIIDWGSLSVMAHEIGHHLCGHTIKSTLNLSQRRIEELQADEFSGFILSKLGATLEQAISFVSKLESPIKEAESTHPNVSKRIIAIENGYKKAKGGKFKENLVDANKEVHNCESILIEANNLLEVKHYSEAISRFRKLIEMNMYKELSYYSIASILYETKDYNESIIYSNKAIELNSTDYLYYLLRGKAKIEKGIKEEYASRDIIEAINLNPLNSELFTYCGKALEIEEDIEGSIRNYTRALELNSSNCLAWFGRGYAKLKLPGIDSKHCDDFKIACKMCNNCFLYDRLCLGKNRNK